nr:uncharacterized protein LOC105867626 [Microcebus murinus]
MESKQEEANLKNSSSKACCTFPTTDQPPESSSLPILVWLSTVTDHLLQLAWPQSHTTAHGFVLLTAQLLTVAAAALGAGRSSCCPVPFVAGSGSGRPRRAELPRARRGSPTATTEQPRDWPPRAPFAAVPFPGALTPFSGWDCSGGADSAGIAAEAAAAAERGSMFSPGQEEHCAPNKEPVKYGELVVLGYNGALPNGDRGRRKSRFALYKRPKANGVRPSTVHVISTPQASKVGWQNWTGLGQQ